MRKYAAAGLVLIPVLMVALGKAKMIPFGDNKEVKTAE